VKRQRCYTCGEKFTWGEICKSFLRLKEIRCSVCETKNVVSSLSIILVQLIILIPMLVSGLFIFHFDHYLNMIGATLVGLACLLLIPFVMFYDAGKK
jgi:CXXC-20-CXXC protein